MCVIKIMSAKHEKVVIVVIVLTEAWMIKMLVDLAVVFRCIVLVMMNFIFLVLQAVLRLSRMDKNF